MGNRSANSDIPTEGLYSSHEGTELQDSLDNSLEEYVDARHAAKYLSISSKKLLALARSGHVPAHGIGEHKRRMWRPPLGAPSLDANKRGGKREKPAITHRQS